MGHFLGLDDEYNNFKNTFLAGAYMIKGNIHTAKKLPEYEKQENKLKDQIKKLNSNINELSMSLPTKVTTTELKSYYKKINHLKKEKLQVEFDISNLEFERLFQFYIQCF